jgi:SWI/SNF-related matrix-associated actin-dependent regulator 1 of chromatin subfamily A
MKQLVKGTPHFIALTGTPIMNRPVEIYNALSMINPFVVPNYWQFTQRYCGAKYNGFGWDFNGASNTEELHRLLTGTVMIRRKKADVLKDLPDKVYSSIPMELENQKEYDYAEANFIDFVKHTKGQEAADKASNAAVITQIEGLKQLAVKGKMNAVIEWVHDFLESGEKLVLFAIHKSAIDQLMEEFKGLAVKIDGSVTADDRNKAVEAFQNDDRVRLFIGNIKAAGVGLTLTAASNVAFIEYPWTPGELKQAEDRCHRIGQKNSVNIHHLVAYHTIEGEIVDLLDSKTKVLDAVLDGHETHEESLLSSLIKSALKR